MILRNNNMDFLVNMCMCWSYLLGLYFPYLGRFLICSSVVSSALFLAGVSYLMCLALSLASNMQPWGKCSGFSFLRHNCWCGDGYRMSNLSTCMGRSFFAVQTFGILRTSRWCFGMRYLERLDFSCSGQLFELSMMRPTSSLPSYLWIVT